MSKFERKVSIDGISVEEDRNGKFTIHIDKEYINRIKNIICEESGKPGIIGPDVYLNLKKMIDNEIKEAETSMKEMYK